MLKHLQIIFEGLYEQNYSFVDIPFDSAAKFLKRKNEECPHPIYYEFLTEIAKLKNKYIPIVFIERFCLSKISERILNQYAINVAEAFALSYVLLNKVASINLLHFKMGHSGLLNPALINGERVEDVEAISKFIIKSLNDAHLINIVGDNVLIGKGFSFNE